MENIVRRGVPPKFSDLEVIALSMTPEILSIDSENYLFIKSVPILQCMSLARQQTSKGYKPMQKKFSLASIVMSVCIGRASVNIEVYFLQSLNCRQNVICTYNDLNLEACSLINC